MGSPVRVGVVDDHPSIVAAVSDAIALADGLELAGTGRTLADALALVPNVDVLVCDVQLDGRAEGLRVLEAALGAANKPAVLLVSGFGSASVVRAAIERGARVTHWFPETGALLYDGRATAEENWRERTGLARFVPGTDPVAEWAEPETSRAWTKAGALPSSGAARK